MNLLVVSLSEPAVIVVPCSSQKSRIEQYWSRFKQISLRNVVLTTSALATTPGTLILELL